MALKSPISLLQEYCVSHHYTIPKYEYTETKIHGNPSIFTCKCYCKDLITTAQAPAKKDAKNIAAVEMMHKFDLKTPSTESGLKIQDAPPSKLDCTPISPSKNAVSQLNEYCSKNSLPYPTYEEAGVRGTSFVTKCLHGNLVTEGAGLKKKDSKQEAAQKMIERLERDGCDLPAVVSNNNITDEKIMEIYNILSSSNKAFKQKPVVEKNIKKTHTPVEPSRIVNESYSIDQLEEKLKNLDVNFKITSINQSPCILSFQRVNHNESENTFLQLGDTFQETKLKLLDQALNKYENFN